MARNIKVIKNEEDPEAPEVLASAIVKIGNAFEKLGTTGITQSGVIALLQNMPGMQGVGKTEIRLVLDNMKKLRSYYVK